MKLQTSFHLFFLLFTFYFHASRSRAQPQNGPSSAVPPGKGTRASGAFPLEWSETRNIVWKMPLPRPRMVVSGYWRRPGLAHDRRRRGGRRVAARARVRCRNGSRAAQRRSLSAANANLKNPKNSHASPTPIVEGDRVYVHFGGEGTAALDAASGAIVWAKKFPYASQHGSGGSPALSRDLLIFSGDGHYEAWVIALDKRTGEVRWKTERRKPFDQAYTTPLVISRQRPRSGRQRRRISRGCLRSRLTGKEIWLVRYEDGFSNVPRPVFAHGLVYIATGFFQPAVLAVRPDGTGDVTATHIAWSMTRGAPFTPSPIAGRRRAVRHQRPRRAVLRRCEDRKASLAGARRRQSLGLADLCRRPHLLPQRGRGRDRDCAG